MDSSTTANKGSRAAKAAQSTGGSCSTMQSQEGPFLYRKKSIGTELSDRLKNANIVSAGSYTDEVFENSAGAPTGPAGGTGQKIGDFPPAYAAIRAGKFKRLMAGKFGSVCGIHRLATDKIGFPRCGMDAGNDGRVYSVQNYHCTEKGLNMSISISKVGKDNLDTMDCLSCVQGHSLRNRIESGLPVAIVLADQNFPASAPAANGDCLTILRVEDGLLPEIENAFSERFRAYLAPHGVLPSGSVIMIGSLSHLHARGVADYAEAVVGVTNTLLAKAGNGVDVVPLIPIPLGGIEKVATIRSLLDFDSWLATASAPGGTTLPSTRHIFWETVLSNGEGTVQSSGEYTVMMPVSTRNPRKRPMVSERISDPIPCKINPVTPLQEKKIVHAMLSELNSVYGLTLDCDPDLSREPLPPASLDESRTVLIGASHMSRVASALIVEGEDVSNLATPGWIPSKSNLKTAADFCESLKLEKGDRVVIDIWSNTAYMGSDEHGLPHKAFKESDGKYHIKGSLQAAPQMTFKVLLKDTAPVIAACKEATVVFVAPFPRYVTAGCCDDPEHLTNRNSDDLKVELYKAIDLATLAMSPSRMRIF